MRTGHQSFPAYKFNTGSLQPSIIVHKLLLPYNILLTWVQKDKHRYKHACIHAYKQTNTLFGKQFQETRCTSTATASLQSAVHAPSGLINIPSLSTMQHLKLQVFSLVFAWNLPKDKLAPFPRHHIDG